MKFPSRRSMNWTGTILLGLVAAAAMLMAAGPDRQAAPDLGSGADLHGKAVFPQQDLWNLDVSNAPVDPNSDAIIASIGANKALHTDFGTTWQGQPNGIPYIVVPGNQPKVPVLYVEYGDESDRGPFPIPPEAPIEGGPNNDGDRHVLVIDRDRWILYELFHAQPVDGGKSWKAGSGAVFDLSKDTIRPAGWTSADAAGLPIFPGLVRYDEAVGRREINHALRFTVERSRRAYLPPARHCAAHSNDAKLPPMGMRVRLRADFDISGFGKSAQVILRALKKYGMIVADNGGDWYLSGAPDPRWDDDELHTLGKIHGRDFQVIKMEGLVAQPR